MAALNDIVQYLNDFLEVPRFDDYSPNGLQVQGTPDVKKVITGVTASQALLDAAVKHHADAVLVHHGYFWKGEDPCVIDMKRRRLHTLLTHDISLLGYHLPLDAHRIVGNNAQLAEKLGLSITGIMSDIIYHGALPSPMTAQAFGQHIEQVLGRAPLVVSSSSKPITSIAWCSGGAQDYIMHAAELGVDAYLTGEVSEQTFHIAQEMNLHFFAAGHHATERYGIQALGAHIAQHFSLDVEFIDIPNPV